MDYIASLSSTCTWWSQRNKRARQEEKLHHKGCFHDQDADHDPDEGPGEKKWGSRNSQCHPKIGLQEITMTMMERTMILISVLLALDPKE